MNWRDDESFVLYLIAIDVADRGDDGVVTHCVDGGDEGVAIVWDAWKEGKREANVPTDEEFVASLKSQTEDMHWCGPDGDPFCGVEGSIDIVTRLRDYYEEQGRFCSDCALMLDFMRSEASEQILDGYISTPGKNHLPCEECGKKVKSEYCCCRVCFVVYCDIHREGHDCLANVKKAVGDG